MVPVSDQDEAIAFYTSTLGFSLVADVPFGEGERWVEVAPPGGGTALALVPPRGVGVDSEMMGGDGTVPLLFFFRDHDANHLMIAEGQ
jgi:catechol 2,3-dioxygenase-like lactoylglutathione lyase family enzyme